MSARHAELVEARASAASKSSRANVSARLMRPEVSTVTTVASVQSYWPPSAVVRVTDWTARMLPPTTWMVRLSTRSDRSPTSPIERVPAMNQSLSPCPNPSGLLSTYSKPGASSACIASALFRAERAVERPRGP